MKHNDCIIIHYDEISLKGNNRKWFENILINNIKKHFSNLPFENISLKSARLIINKIDSNQIDLYKESLKNIVGTSSALIVKEIEQNLITINKVCLSMITAYKPTSFRLTTKRNDKNFLLTSPEINSKVGAYIQSKINIPVNLKKPEMEIIIELVDGKTYIGYDKINGFGGLPANSNEKALSLLSGGIDSPVASFELIKRGVKLDFVHFHSYPATKKNSIHNVEKLCQKLTNYQLDSVLYKVPLLEIQQNIMKECDEKYWIILFRRAMMKIANYLAKKNHTLALITGDNIGQVASQTISNIYATSDSSELPILRPLAGKNKNEIINIAKIIGTYSISIEPFEDCCSFFVPENPIIKANLNQIFKYEKKINFNTLFNNTINQIVIKKFKA